MHLRRILRQFLRRDLNQKIREVFVDYIDEVGQLL